jgi:hypothetical protein
VQAVESFNGEPRIVSTLLWRSDARDEAVAKIVATLEKAAPAHSSETEFNGIGRLPTYIGDGPRLSNRRR